MDEHLEQLVGALLEPLEEQPAEFGAAAPGLALFGAFWSWVGFEMAPNYGEEARRRPRIMAAAMLGTLAVLAIVYVLVSYAFVTGYGTDGVAAGSRRSSRARWRRRSSRSPTGTPAAR